MSRTAPASATVQATVYEYRQPAAHLVPGAVGHNEIVLGRITLTPRERYHNNHKAADTTWLLHLLPDVKWGPDFMVSNDGQWKTEADTPQQAQRVLQRACEALNRWLAHNERGKRALLDEIVQAVSAVGVTEQTLPLDLSDDGDASRPEQ